MKIYNRKDFLNLPLGIIFCKGIKWCFDSLCMKGDSCGNDFYYVDQCCIDANNGGELVDRLEDSLINGTSYIINHNSARDGLFNEEDIFLVYEKEDLEFLINVLKVSISKIEQMNNYGLD